MYRRSDICNLEGCILPQRNNHEEKYMWGPVPFQFLYIRAYDGPHQNPPQSHQPCMCGGSQCISTALATGGSVGFAKSSGSGMGGSTDESRSKMPDMQRPTRVVCYEMEDTTYTWLCSRTCQQVWRAERDSPVPTMEGGHECPKNAP